MVWMGAVGSSRADVLSFTAGTQVYNSGTNIAALEPAGVTSGDLLVMIVTTDNDISIAPPDGWTLEEERKSTPGSDRSMVILSIVRGASAPDLVVSSGGADKFVQIIGFTNGALSQVETVDGSNDTSPNSNTGLTGSAGDIAIYTVMTKTGSITAHVVPTGSTLVVSDIVSGSFHDVATAYEVLAGNPGLAEWGLTGAGAGDDSISGTVVVTRP